jgi:hypothetical protein
MRYIAAALLISVAELWGIFALANFLPPSKIDASGPVDTFAAEGWVEESSQIVFGVSRLRDSTRPGIFIFGSSVSREAFRPRDLAALAPGFEAHNLSKGGTTIHEMAEALEHLAKALPRATRRRSIAVIALQLQLMVPNDVRWRKTIFVPEAYRNTPALVTDVGREALRCGPICIPDTVAFAFLPASAVNGAKAYYARLFRFKELLPESLSEWAKSQTAFFKAPEASLIAAIEALRTPKTPGVPPIARADAPLPQIGRAQMIEKARRLQRVWLMGNVSTLDDEQFEELRRLVARARGLGFSVVLVDMPSSSIYSEEWPVLMSHYRDRLGATVSALSSKCRATFVDLHAAAGDDEFRDGLHPMRDFRLAWSRRLMDAIQPVLHRAAAN